MGKSTKQVMVEVEATGPVQHGDADGVHRFVAGDKFSVPLDMAKQLHAAGVVKQPGSKADEKAAAEAKETEDAIAAANAQAEADAKAAAEAAAAGQA